MNYSPCLSIHLASLDLLKDLESSSQVHQRLTSDACERLDCLSARTLRQANVGTSPRIERNGHYSLSKFACSSTIIDIHSIASCASFGPISVVTYLSRRLGPRLALWAHDLPRRGIGSGSGAVVTISPGSMACFASSICSATWPYRARARRRVILLSPISLRRSLLCFAVFSLLPRVFVNSELRVAGSHSPLLLGPLLQLVRPYQRGRTRWDRRWCDLPSERGACC